MHGIVQTALEWQETDFSQRIGLYSTNEDFESSAIVGIFTVSVSLVFCCCPMTSFGLWMKSHCIMNGDETYA